MRGRLEPVHDGTVLRASLRLIQEIVQAKTDGHRPLERDNRSVSTKRECGPIIPHSDFGDPDCCGCLFGVVCGDEADSWLQFSMDQEAKLIMAGVSLSKTSKTVFSLVIRIRS